MKDVPGSIIAANRGESIGPKRTNTVPSSFEYLLCCQIPENGEKAFHQLYSFQPDVSVPSEDSEGAS